MFTDSLDVFRRLIETVKVGVYIADAQGNLKYVNHAFIEILGYSVRDELLGKNLARELYANPKDREGFLKKMEEKGFMQDYEVKNIRKDGSIAILSATSNYIRDDQGKVTGVEGVVHDITEKKKLEESLLNEKRKLEQILGFDEKIGTIRKFDALIDFIVERVASILEADKCSLMLVDDEKNELCIQGAKGLPEDIIKGTRIRLGDPIAGVVAKEGTPILVKNIEYDKRFKRANRPSYASRSFMIAPIKLGDKLIGVVNVADKKTLFHQDESFNEIDLKILCALVREIAVALENVKLYKELNYLTITDSLTGIFNFRHFNNILDYEIKRLKRSPGHLSLLMLDIDGFKSYNDAFGHPEGDQLLKDLAQILKQSVRETDVPCRYAGDEFVIVFPATDVDGVKKVAEKIINSIEKHPFKQKVTVSMGIVGYFPGQSRHEAIQKMDMALYQAKKEGKNKFCILR